MFPIFSASDAFRKSIGGVLENAGYGPHELA